MMFPDAKIAASMELGRNKLKYIINHGLVPYFKNILTEDLGSAEFLSVCFDEILNKRIIVKRIWFYHIGIILKIKYKSAIGTVCLWGIGQLQIYFSSGANGDIFTPFGTKALTQNLKSLPRGNQFLLCQLGSFRSPFRVLGHTVGPDLGFSLPHKVHALVMW